MFGSIACNIFGAVGPRGIKRYVQVTDRRTKEHFVGFFCRMLHRGYWQVRNVHLVVDNLNTRLRSSFEDMLGTEMTADILSRIEFHDTPVHASRLKMAEIGFVILERQCLARCSIDQATLTADVEAWQRRRNAARRGIKRTFTRRDADLTLHSALCLVLNRLMKNPMIEASDSL